MLVTGEQARAKKKRWPTILAVALFFALLAVCFVRFSIAPAYLEKRIVSAIEEQTGLEASVGKTKFGLFKPSVHLSDINIKSPEGFEEPSVARIGELGASMEWKDLLTAKPEFSSLIISDARIVFERSPEDKLNIPARNNEDEEAEERASKTVGEGTDRIEKDREEKIASSDYIFNSIDLHNIEVRFINRESGRRSGNVGVHVNRAKAIELRFGKKNGLMMLEMDDLKFEAPGGFKSNTLLVADSMWMIDSSLGTPPFATAENIEVYYEIRENGETNWKRFRRIVESATTPEDKKDDEEGDRPEKPAFTEIETEDESEARLVQFLGESTFTIKNVQLRTSAKFDGFWQTEQAVFPEIIAEEEYNGSTIRAIALLPETNGKAELVWKLDQHQAIKFHLLMENFPFHALLWEDQLDEDAADMPRVKSALLDITAKGHWQDGKTSGTATLQFAEVIAEEDTRPFWERLKANASGESGGWAKIMNELAGETGQSRVMHLAVREDNTSSSPLAITQAFTQEFHEERLK